MTVRVNELAPDFKEDAFIDDDFKKVSLSEYRGKWVVLFFYPADFTFVCPTELGELADKYDELKKLNTQVISVSVDTKYVHKAWWDHSSTIHKIKFPMLADPARRVASAYGVLIESEGLALRGTFIIDPEGIVKAFEVHNNSIGRNIDELVRKIEAAQYVEKHGGEACPVNWAKGQKALKTGIDMVGKI